MSVSTTARPARPRARKVVLTVSLDGFDILFYTVQCVSLEIALHNFSALATRLWREDNDTTETPIVTASFSR
jgi:hypothetical protein